MTDAPIRHNAATARKWTLSFSSYFRPPRRIKRFSSEERGIFLPGNWGYLTSSFWEEKNSFARRMIYIYRLSDIDILVYYSKENFFKVRNVNVNKYSNLIIINHDNRWLLHGNLSLKNKSKRKCKTSHRRLIREIYSHVRNKHKKEINLGKKYWRTSCALIKQDPSPLILLSIGRIDLMVERFQRSRGNIFSLHDSRRSWYGFEGRRWAKENIGHASMNWKKEKSKRGDNKVWRNNQTAKKWKEGTIVLFFSSFPRKF